MAAQGLSSNSFFRDMALAAGSPQGISPICIDETEKVFSQRIPGRDFHAAGPE
jgi:hypothetical protein